MPAAVIQDDDAPTLALPIPALTHTSFVASSSGLVYFSNSPMCVHVPPRAARAPGRQRRCTARERLHASRATSRHPREYKIEILQQAVNIPMSFVQHSKTLNLLQIISLSSALSHEILIYCIIYYDALLAGDGSRS